MIKGECTKSANWTSKVKHLQEVFNNNAPKSFDDSTDKHIACYLQIEEELKEFHRDILPKLMMEDTDNAEKETRDWIVDMTFFLLQYANKVGVIDKLDEDFHKIYLNNITKQTSFAVAAQSAAKYKDEGTDCYIESNIYNSFVVKRHSDGKVLKCIDYKKVEL